MGRALSDAASFDSKDEKITKFDVRRFGAGKAARSRSGIKSLPASCLLGTIHGLPVLHRGAISPTAWAIAADNTAHGDQFWGVSGFSPGESDDARRSKSPPARLKSLFTSRVLRYRSQARSEIFPARRIPALARFASFEQGYGAIQKSSRAV